MQWMAAASHYTGHALSLWASFTWWSWSLGWLTMSSSMSSSLVEEARSDSLLPVLTLYRPSSSSSSASCSFDSPPPPSTPCGQLRSLCKKGEAEDVLKFVASLDPVSKHDVLNAVTDEGWTSLHEIITHECQFTKVASILMENGANMNTVDANGDTPLHSALLYHNVDNVELLLSHGADPNAVNAAGRRAIHLADDLDTLSLLIQYKADVSAIDSNGNNALHYAVVAKDLDRANLLIDNYDDGNVKKMNLDRKNKNGSTPLHLAADPNVALLLLQQGADHRLGDKVGNSPLHVAVRRRHKELVKTLLAFSANTSALNKYRKTPVAMARDREMRNLLLKNKNVALEEGSKTSREGYSGYKDDDGESNEVNDTNQLENDDSSPGSFDFYKKDEHSKDGNGNIDENCILRNKGVVKDVADEIYEGNDIVKDESATGNNNFVEVNAESAVKGEQDPRVANPCDKRNDCTFQANNDDNNGSCHSPTSDSRSSIRVEEVVEDGKSSYNETSVNDTKEYNGNINCGKPDALTTPISTKPVKRPSSVLSSSFVVISSEESRVVQGILKRPRTEPRQGCKGPRLRFSDVNDYSGVEVVEDEGKRVKVAPLYTELHFSSDEDDDDDDEDYRE